MHYAYTVDNEQEKPRRKVICVTINWAEIKIFKLRDTLIATLIHCCSEAKHCTAGSIWWTLRLRQWPTVVHSDFSLICKGIKKQIIRQYSDDTYSLYRTIEPGFPCQDPQENSLRFTSRSGCLHLHLAILDLPTMHHNTQDGCAHGLASGLQILWKIMPNSTTDLRWGLVVLQLKEWETIKCLLQPQSALTERVVFATLPCLLLALTVSQCVGLRLDWVSETVRSSGSETEWAEWGSPSQWRCHVWPVDWASGTVIALSKFLGESDWHGQTDTRLQVYI